MAHHHKMDCLVKRFDCCVVVKVKVAGKVKNSSDCSSGWYSSTVEPAVTKLGMVMQHHDPECQAEKNGLLFVRSRTQQGLVWSKYDSIIPSELLILWQPNLVWWYIIISQSVLWKKWITAFKVKVIVKSQNQCLSRWYLLNRVTFCY